MVRSEGSIWKRIIVSIKKLNTKIRRAVIGTLVWFRLGNTIFIERQLETRFIKISSSRMIGLKMLEEIITKNIEHHNFDRVLKKLELAVSFLNEKNENKSMERLYIAGLRALSTFNLQKSIEFGEQYLDDIADENAIQSLVTFYQRCGHIEKPYKLLKKIKSSRWKDKEEEKLKKELDLLQNGIFYKDDDSAEIEELPKNIMYHVNQSLPHHSSGYAIRTQSLLKNLKKKNWNIEAYARIGYPNDRYDFTGLRTVDSLNNVDGVNYHFVPSRKKGIGLLDIQKYQDESVKLIIEQAKKFKPSIIHCASNYSCGLAGTAAAKLLGIPSIYEVRGLWHVTRTSKQSEYANSDHYRMIEKLEAQAAKNADHVFAITQGVKNVLTKNGVNERNITILPNAVDPIQFKPIKKNKKLEEKLGLIDKITIGYIGSFTDYEGLDYLLKALSILKEKYYEKVKVILVGDGTAYGELKRLSKELNLEDIIHFTGRIEHSDVLDYYSVIDVAVYPRKGTSVCEIVSPLKPLEAMAMGKAIIASEVDALAEMIMNEQTGLLHARDDINNLTDKLEKLILNSKLRAQLGENAKKWVVKNRTWEDASKKVDAVYKQLINPKRIE